MSQKEMQTEPVQPPVKKEDVDRYMRPFRSKGGKNRWKGPEVNSPSARKEFSESLRHGWMCRREKDYRSLVVDGVSPYKKNVRLVLSTSMGDVLEAKVGRGKGLRTERFPICIGFGQAWTLAQFWIAQQKAENRNRRNV